MAETNPYTLRVSPSGAQVGNPPAQLNTGNFQGGDSPWIYEGEGAERSIPGSSAAGDFAGLEACPVSLLPGYAYDLDFTMNSYASGGTSGSFNIVILGSLQSTPTVFNQAVAASYGYSWVFPGTARLRSVFSVVPGSEPIVALKVQLRSTVAAGAGLGYLPAEGVLEVHQYTSI